MNAQQALKELAGPIARGENQRAIDRAAKAAGLDYWRAFDIWYAKARRIEPHELAALSDALQAKREHDAANELHDLKLRLLRLEARLAADAHNHRPVIDAFGPALRGAR